MHYRPDVSRPSRPGRRPGGFSVLLGRQCFQQRQMKCCRPAFLEACVWTLQSRPTETKRTGWTKTHIWCGFNFDLKERISLIPVKKKKKIKRKETLIWYLHNRVVSHHCRKTLLNNAWIWTFVPLLWWVLPHQAVFFPLKTHAERTSALEAFPVCLPGHQPHTCRLTNKRTNTDFQ